MLPRRTNLLVFLVVLSAATLFAVAMVAVLQIQRTGVVDARKFVWRDSTSALVFGFERHLLQFRGELAVALNSNASPVDLRAAAQRYEILVSRIDLLKTSSSLDVLRERPEYRILMPKLDGLVQAGDRLLAAASAPRADAQALLEQTDAMAADVQSYASAAASTTTTLIEEQFQVLQRQALVIGALAVLQLLLMAVTLYTLWARHKQQTAARLELECLAEELREAKLGAEAANRTKSQFLANMSHELRTPFQGVLGMLQLLEGTALAPSQRELIHTARESANHLLLVLNETLDLSAIEAGKMVLHESPTDLNKLCHEVEGLMRIQADSCGLNLLARFDPGLPPWASGDATRIKQILFNLLSNAIKFTPAGEVRFDVSCSRPDAGHASLSFSVSDTGIGMDEQTFARLFQRFEPGDSTLSRRFAGAGLGLEISRGLARLMGGDLVAQSRPGEGSRFILNIELALSEAPADLLPLPVALAPLAHLPLSVLVADDHPINRRYLELVLQGLGHGVTLCENGEEALEIVQTERFDAILMDVHMPVMDGLAATRAIRALGGRYQALPILALTADVMSGARERAIAAGFSAFLPKPVQIEHLSAALGNPAASRGAVVKPPDPVSQPTSSPLSERFDQLAAALAATELRKLVAMFFCDESKAFAELRDALAQRQRDPVLRAAHKFRGSARVLGFASLAEAAECAETWARSQEPSEQCGPLALRLENAMMATTAALEGWLDHGAADGTDRKFNRMRPSIAPWSSPRSA